MNRSQFLRARARIVIALVAVTALGAAAAAVAHHGPDSMYKTSNTGWGCNDDDFYSNDFCQTDNDFLTVWRQSSLTSTGKSNIASALNNEFAPTDLSISFVSSPSYSGSAETDIIYQENDLPGTVIGVAWCNDSISSTKCDQHYVAFESASPGTALACHETGHAVGLTHGADASPQLLNGDNSLQCMTTPVETGNLGTHNTQQINATYPN